MGIWEGRKKVVWRDRSGNIRCPGDDCPQKECDESCPIWLNTMASSCYAIGEVKPALASLEKASKIAPDFYDAWNNMGAMYGLLGDYQQAHDCYLEAHKLNPGKNQPLFGLALSSRDLKLYDECLRWCDDYDKLCSDHRCDDARATAQEALKKAQKPSSAPQEDLSPVAICTWLLKEGYKAGFVHDEKAFPHILEIMVQARPVVIRLLSEIQEKFPANYALLTPVWSTYAALGAVRFWYDDWDTLKETGIVQALTAPRGIVEMDEYVTDYIGWEFGSKKSDDFVQHIHNLAMMTSVRISELTDGDQEKKAEAFVNMLMAFYYYGMVIEMNELGMK